MTRCELTEQDTTSIDARNENKNLEGYRNQYNKRPIETLQLEFIIYRNKALFINFLTLITIIFTISQPFSFTLHFFHHTFTAQFTKELILNMFQNSTKCVFAITSKFIKMLSIHDECIVYIC